jgi:hypothetical protein
MQLVLNTIELFIERYQKMDKKTQQGDLPPGDRGTGTVAERYGTLCQHGGSFHL